MKTFATFCFLFLIICTNAQEITDKKSFKKCRKEFSKKICLSDEDQDGVLFYLDHCRKESGSAENGGCPWQNIDGDEVIDKDDACPSVAGPPENNGCPWPDTDQDGILDKDDACPTVPGYPPYGCSGRNGRSCPESYEQTKENYLKKKFALDHTDFSKLFKILFENEDFKVSYLKGSRNVLLYLRPIEDGPECGNDAYYECPRYEKNISEDVFQKLWSKENYNEFQNLSLDKIIIPFSNRENWYQFDENYNYLLSQSFKPVFNGTFINLENKKYNFTYTSNSKPSTKLSLNANISSNSENNFQYVQIKVLPIDYKELINAYILTFITIDGEKQVSKQLIYQFEEEKWKFIEEFKLQIKN